MGNFDLTALQASAVEGRHQKRTLKQVFEERDALLERTGHYYGIEHLSLRDADPMKFERFYSRLHTCVLAAREVARYVAASPGGREMGESLWALALATAEGDSLALSLGFFSHTAAFPVAVRYMADKAYDLNPGIRDGDMRGGRLPRYAALDIRPVVRDVLPNRRMPCAPSVIERFASIGVMMHDNSYPASSESEVRQGAGVRFVVQTRLPTEWGEFMLHGFSANGKEHLALVLGEVGGSTPVLVRVHSECLTGDSLFSQRCDCGGQLRAALASIAGEGRGILLYLRQEGRGIGLLNKLRAYSLQDHGADTVDANERLGFPADARDYGVCKAMLMHLGVTKLRVMINNPRKLDALRNLGFEVVERVPLVVGAVEHNCEYLSTKATRLGHWLDETAPTRVG